MLQVAHISFLFSIDIIMQFDVAKHCSEPLTAKKFRDDCLSKIGAQAISRHRRDITIEDVIASQNTDIETANALATICDPANLRV